MLFFGKILQYHDISNNFKYSYIVTKHHLRWKWFQHSAYGLGSSSWLHIVGLSYTETEDEHSAYVLSLTKAEDRHSNSI